MGGRGGSSGLSGGVRASGTIYERFNIQKNRANKFDASRLQGSDEQKSYAQNIVNNAFNTADNEIKQAIDKLDHYASKGRYDELFAAYTAAKVRAYIETKNKIEDMANKTKSASSIIKNRFTIQNVIPTMRNSLEEKYRKEYEQKVKKKK